MDFMKFKVRFILDEELQASCSHDIQIVLSNGKFPVGIVPTNSNKNGKVHPLKISDALSVLSISKYI